MIKMYVIPMAIMLILELTYEVQAKGTFLKVPLACTS